MHRVDANGSPKPGLDPKAERIIGNVRRWSHLLDSAFRIPGTRFRFGWDPLIGLVPGLGDVIAGLASFLIVTQAFRLRLPHVIKARMILNVLIELAVGAIPLLGDLFDMTWKSNLRNLALLERHAGVGAKPAWGDWAFVSGIAAAALAMVAVPILLLILLLQQLQTWINGASIWNI